MPILRRYVVTEIRQVEIDAADPTDAVIKADEHFYPTAETLIARKGRPLPDPKIVSIEARDKRP